MLKRWNYFFQPVLTTQFAQNWYIMQKRIIQTIVIRNWSRWNEHTNWNPVSLRIPTPAEAKLAPTRRLFPLSNGSKYALVGSIPICSPGKCTFNNMQNGQIQSILSKSLNSVRYDKLVYQILWAFTYRSDYYFFIKDLVQLSQKLELRTHMPYYVGPKNRCLIKETCMNLTIMLKL